MKFLFRYITCSIQLLTRHPRIQDGSALRQVSILLCWMPCGTLAGILTIWSQPRLIVALISLNAAITCLAPMGMFS